MYNWHKIERLTIDTLQPEKMQEYDIAGKRIGILKLNDAVYAFSATCPHTSAPLCEGWLDAQKRIVCPLHKYRFDPANGRNTSGEGYKLKTYPVEIRDNEIYIGIL